MAYSRLKKMEKAICLMAALALVATLIPAISSAEEVIHDVGISAMKTPEKVNVSGGRYVGRKVVVTVKNYGSVPEPNAVVSLYATHPDGTRLIYGKERVYLDLRRGGTKVTIWVELHAYYGLGTVEWRSEVAIPYPEPIPDTHPNSGGPEYTEIWAR